MKARLRRLASRLRRAALGPLLAHVDEVADGTNRRLDELTKRVSDMEAILQAVEGRAATVSERAVIQQESHARLARRLDEIEKLLSER